MNPVLSLAKKLKFMQSKAPKKYKAVKMDEHVDIKEPGFETKYVKDVYNSIAPHFSHTRYKPWPGVVDFLTSIPKHALVADVGCGNGKNMACVDHLQFIGSDISSSFIEICREKLPASQVLVADAVGIPMRSGSVDHAISIAVIHHFANVERRQLAIGELLRIVREGGRVLIYVWGLVEGSKPSDDQDIFILWNNQRKYEEKNTSNKAEKQFNEEKGTFVYKRYYHIFVKGELEDLVESCRERLEFGFDVVKSFQDEENFCIELQKGALKAQNKIN